MRGPSEQTDLIRSENRTFRQLIAQRDGGKIILGLVTPMRVSFQFLSEYRAGQDQMWDALETLGRNTFRGPAYYDFDFALIKTTPIARQASGVERAALQFRAEFFNLFNIVNMGLPANTIKGSGFGVISKTAGTSRQIQFSLKVIY